MCLRILVSPRKISKKLLRDTGKINKQDGRKNMDPKVDLKNSNWRREKTLKNGDTLVWLGPDLDSPWEVIQYSATEVTAKGNRKQVYRENFYDEASSLVAYNSKQ
jgi:hypothetical protein